MQRDNEELNHMEGGVYPLCLLAFTTYDGGLLEGPYQMGVAYYLGSLCANPVTETALSVSLSEVRLGEVYPNKDVRRGEGLVSRDPGSSLRPLIRQMRLRIR